MSKFREWFIPITQLAGVGAVGAGLWLIEPAVALVLGGIAIAIVAQGIAAGGDQE